MYEYILSGFFFRHKANFDSLLGSVQVAATTCLAAVPNDCVLVAVSINQNFSCKYTAFF
jgi:hypothetical protein